MTPLERRCAWVDPGSRASLEAVHMRIHAVTAMPHWIQWLQALSVPTIAVVGVFLVWQQARIARTKASRDLFDRRFAVFEAARTLLARVMAKGNASAEDVNRYSL